jgi:tight adherence protein B
LVEQFFNSDTLFIASVGIGVLALGIVVYVLFGAGSGTEKRVSQMNKSKSASKKNEKSRIKALASENAQDKRSKVQAKLKELEQKNKAKKRRVPLKMRIEQAGLTLSPTMYYVWCALFGALLAFGVLLSGALPLIAAGAGFVGAIGFPLWVLGFLCRKRQKMFLLELPNSLDIIIRGVRSGLPINDGFKIVANESPAPVGPEFALLIEGQKLGLTIDQGLERMFERIPIPEVNFLAIVINIQSKAGGNLAEALSNLSNVLRDRKKMKSKFTAVSQEAKSSAAIIGSLPLAIMGIMSFTSPEYVEILWTDKIGKMMLMGSGVWMLMGVLVMRKMINFKI